MMHWGGEYGMGFGGWIFMILFWVLIILATVYLVKALLGKSPPDGSTGESAREVLEKRYARGEITKEEFQDAMDTLRRNRG